jgi:hypothetical protein
MTTPQEKTRFTSQQPMIATEKDCKGRWFDGNNGEHFRCHLCGYKLQPGEHFRWIYTNNLPRYGGNPIVCKLCDGSNEDVIERWKSLCDQWQKDKNEKYWSFVRREQQSVDARCNTTMNALVAELINEAERRR